MDPSTIPDEELLSRFLRSHDHEAFQELVSRHADMVFGLSHRVLRHHQDAEDAFQATFLVLARDAKKIRRPHALAGWLYGVAYRMAMSALARKRRRKEVELEDTMAKTESPFAEIARRREQGVIDEEVQCLPEVYRNIVLMRYFEGRSTKEVAQQLQMTTGAVKGRLERAKRVLRRQLLSRGVFVGAIGIALDAQQTAIASVDPVLVEKTALAGINLISGEGLEGLVTSNASTLATQEFTMLTSTSLKICLATVFVVFACFSQASRRIIGQESAIQFEVDVNDDEWQVTGNPIHVTHFVANVDDDDLRRGDDGDHITSVAFNPTGNYLAGGSFDGTVKIWSARTGELHSTLKGHTAYVRTVVYSPDGKTVASGGDDRTVRIWNANDGKLLRILRNHPGDVLALAFAENGQTLVSVGWERRGAGDENQKGFLRFFNASTGATTGQLELQSPIMVVAAKKNLVAIADCNGTVHTYDVKNAKRVQAWKAHDTGVLAICVSKNGRQLATGSFDRSVRVWNAETGELVRNLDGHAGEVRSIAFSPDGKTLASGSDVGYVPSGTHGGKKLMSQVQMWDITNGNLLHSLNGTLGQTWALAYSSAGLLARCDSGAVEVLSSDMKNVLWHAHHE